jgi:hypothetical protein
MPYGVQHQDTAYTYDETTIGWNAEKKEELIKKLKDVTFGIRGGVGRRRPYVDGVSFRSGVMIRRMEFIPEEQRQELIRQADRIYREVMLAEEANPLDAAKGA